MATRLIEIVESLGKARVVLIGDLMIDRYFYGNAERLSPDAPVPVLHYQREEIRLGGAGRVAADLATLGAKVEVVATIGADEAGKHIVNLLGEYGIGVGGLVQTPGRPSTSKVRLVGLAQHRHPQQMMRLDYEDARDIEGTVADAVVANVVKAIEGADVLCIEDYNKGLLSPDVCKRVIAAARQKGVATIVDPAAISDYSKYAGAAALKPNRFEAAKATGAGEAPENAAASAQRLMESLGLEAAIITLDKHGVYLGTRDKSVAKQIKGKERKVYDVTGAGDMLLAVVSAVRATGATWEEAVTLGNVASGLECEKSGSVPLTRQEIIDELLLEGIEAMGKQRSLDRLLPEIALLKKAGKRIVFTNGCFDLIHLGHVKYFQFAKAQGDVLVVGVNTDAGIRRLKGDKRPIIGQEDRIGVLEELESIDYLVKFDEDTPLKLIEAIRPDVLVKGADYRKEQVVGWDVVEGYGGSVALAPLIDGRSTSAVIQRILAAHSD